jgi:hypothetical protein
MCNKKFADNRTHAFLLYKKGLVLGLLYGSAIRCWLPWNLVDRIGVLQQRSILQIGPLTRQTSALGDAPNCSDQTTSQASTIRAMGIKSQMRHTRKYRWHHCFICHTHHSYPSPPYSHRQKARNVVPREGLRGTMWPGLSSIDEQCCSEICSFTSILSTSNLRKLPLTMAYHGHPFPPSNIFLQFCC